MKTPPTTPIEMLRSIQKRPAMYFGTSERPFSSLIAFLSGFETAAHFGRIEFVPEDFHRFVTERFGRPYPDGGKGWMTFVRENTKTEEAALDLFIRLREEFEATRKPDA
jgi:hypothetical protein